MSEALTLPLYVIRTKSAFGVLTNSQLKTILEKNSTDFPNDLEPVSMQVEYVVVDAEWWKVPRHATLKGVELLLIELIAWLAVSDDSHSIETLIAWPILGLAFD